MTRKQVQRHDRRCMIFLLIVAAVLVVHITATTIRGNQRQQERAAAKVTEPKGEEFAVEETERIHERGNLTESEANAEHRMSEFDEMSEDWGSDADGFVYYQIPEEYTVHGGYFPEKMQIYTYSICKQYDVKYALVVAMIERESGYVFDDVGDDGNSKGYMQIYESAHPDRMENMGCTDLMNPYQNVRVGIDYIAGLIEKYGTIQDALAAYNYGEAGAKRNLWSNGIYLYEYNESIMKRMKEIEEEVGA